MSLTSTTGKDGIAVLRLQNPPANAISRGLLSDLKRALDELERKPPRALVLSAEGDRFFSAGLDLIELYDLDRPVMETLFEDLLQVFLRIFRFPMPVVAAVNGHAIAGGAILALTADRRLSARGDHLFGLNEVRVGLPLPGPLFEVVRSATRPERASEVLLEGKNYGVDDALRIGFVHHLVDRVALEVEALATAERLALVPRRAYERMKELLHADTEARIRKMPVDPFIDIWFHPDTRRAMGEARAKLLKKR